MYYLLHLKIAATISFFFHSAVNKKHDKQTEHKLCKDLNMLHFVIVKSVT